MDLVIGSIAIPLYALLALCLVKHSDSFTTFQLVVISADPSLLAPCGSELYCRRFEITSFIFRVQVR